MNQLNINEGLTNNYLIPGVFGCLVSIAITVYFPYIGIPLLILSTAWFAATNGLEISEDGLYYRRYAGYLGFKIGRWKPLVSPTKALLIISSETSSMFKNVGMGLNAPYFMGGSFYGRNGKMKSLTYDIILYSSAMERTILYNFLSYKDAKAALLALENKLGLETEDRVAEKVARNRNRRRR